MGLWNGDRNASSKVEFQLPSDLKLGEFGTRGRSAGKRRMTWQGQHASTNSAFDAFVLSSVPQRGAIEQQQQHQQQKSSRSTSCCRCRRLKIKCDDGRPCKRCTLKAFGSSCEDCDKFLEQAQSKNAELAVGRPLNFQTLQIEVPPSSCPFYQCNVLPATLSDTLVKEFRGGVWLSRDVSERLFKIMPEGTFSDRSTEAFVLTLCGLAEKYNLTPYLSLELYRRFARRDPLCSGHSPALPADRGLRRTSGLRHDSETRAGDPRSGDQNSG
eukprot:511518-Rhodomonas_salina.3